MQYKAPELFRTKRMGGARYEKPADLYSFSMLTWEVFTGEVPWAGTPDNELTAMHLEALADANAVERPERRDGPLQLAGGAAVLRRGAGEDARAVSETSARPHVSVDPCMNASTHARMHALMIRHFESM